MGADYHAPAGGLDIAIPRTPTRIVVQTCLIHLCAGFTYTYLCDFVPRLRKNGFHERCIQVLLFWHVPEYLFLQQFVMMLAVSIEQSGITNPPGLLQFASLAGSRRFESRVYLEEVSAISWTRFLFMAAAMVGCWFGATAYVERFRISYHQMADVGNLGIDHRNGWISFAGLLAGSLALLIRAYVWYTTQFQPSRTAATDAEPGRTREQLEKDEDGYDFDACRMLLLDMKLDHGVMLVEAFSAAVIHQIPLIATHRAISIISFLPASIVLLAVLTVLALKQSRPAIAQKASLGLKWLPIFIIVWTILEPSLHDLNELYDASTTVLHEWSFRWQITDRFDRLLRPFV